MYRISYQIVILFFFVFSAERVYNQNTDSLLNQIDSNTPDSTISKIYYQIAHSFYADSTDTAEFYYSKAITASRIATQSVQSFNILFELSNYYRDRNIYDRSIEYALECIVMAMENKDSSLLTRSYSNLGNIYYQMEVFEKALENFNLAISHLSTKENPREAGRLFGRMGNLYLVMEADYDLAESYFNKAVAYFEEANFTQGVVIATLNLGVVEKRRGNFMKAIEYYNSALKSYEIMNNQVGIAHCQANIGNIYFEEKQYDKALSYLQQSLKIYRSNKMYNDLIINYAEIARVYNGQGKPDESLENLYKAKELNDQYGLNNKTLLSIYEEQIKAYLLQGDTIKAFKQLYKYRNLNDTLSKRESQSRIDRLQVQFNVAQKEKDIALLTAEKSLNVAKIKRKNILQVFYLVTIGLSAISLITLYFHLKTKQRANLLLTQKNNEILHQKEEIEAQRDEIEAQKEEIETQRDDIEVQRGIAINQRDEITRQKKHITDSINYAKHIQTALLPNDVEVKEVIRDSFIFFNPLDIVSGDFYWVSKKNNQSIVVSADCTGHGVPGALMSVMGINFLTSIVEEMGITDPGQILTLMNDKVIDALSHADGCMQDKDGMDISLCSIDFDNLTIHYSCARNKILIWRKGEIIQLEADKFSIGKSPFVNRMKYQTFSYPIEKNDMIYLMTDGYIDQFGGPDKTKYLATRFKNFIKQIGSLQPDQQLQLLEQNISNWMGNHLQIDDMLIVGIRV